MQRSTLALYGEVASGFVADLESNGYRDSVVGAAAIDVRLLSNIVTQLTADKTQFGMPREITVALTAPAADFHVSNAAAVVRLDGLLISGAQNAPAIVVSSGSAVGVSTELVSVQLHAMLLCNTYASHPALIVDSSSARQLGVQISQSQIHAPDSLIALQCASCHLIWLSDVQTNGNVTGSAALHVRIRRFDTTAHVALVEQQGAVTVRSSIMHGTESGINVEFAHGQLLHWTQIDGPVLLGVHHSILTGILNPVPDAVGGAMSVAIEQRVMVVEALRFCCTGLF